jgi:AcrR family transcriptional regulator
MRDSESPLRTVTGAPPARRSRTPSAEVERGLLAAAEAVLVREGPGGLTVRAVAAEGGIAPMGVYNRLGGKDGLVDALLIKGFDRLRATLEAGDEPDTLERLRSCCLRYRAFALGNKHFYAIMFEEAIPRGRDSAEVGERARAAFGVLVRAVELAAAARVLDAPGPFEAAQQIWSCAHGAVALELKGLVLTADPEAAYRALVETLIRGLAPR